MQKRVNTSNICVIIRMVTQNMVNSSWGLLKAKAVTIVTMYRLEVMYSQYHGSVLEITGGHWPFSDQYSTFGRPKSNLVGQTYCVFTMEQLQ